MSKSISVIVPLYNEEECISDLYTSILSSLGKVNFEIVFVDDGSIDSSLAILKSLALKDLRVKVISLRKNSGQTAAIAAGFDAASGDVLVNLDADLQNDPKDILKLVNLLNGDVGVVSGWRKFRKDNLSRRVPSYLANKLISMVTGVRLHDYGCSLKAYRKDIVKDIKLYGEMHRFLPALAGWVGAKIVEVPVDHHPRTRGKSKYGIGRTFKVVLDLITIKFLTNYATKPNYIFGGLGGISLFLGFLAMLIVIYRVFVLKSTAATPMVFMMVVFLVSGVQLILMGFLAEILIRTHFESQDKPIYFVKEKVNL